MASGARSFYEAWNLSEQVVYHFVIRYLVRIIRLAYPLVLWASLFRILDLIGYSPGPLVSGLITSLKPFYTYIGIAAFVFLLLVMLFFSFLSVSSYRSIEKNVPEMVKDFLRSPSHSKQSVLKEKLNELIVATATKFQLYALGILSGLKQTMKKHPKQSIVAVVAYYAIVYPGSVVVTIDILDVVRPVVTPLLGTLGYLFGSLTGVAIALLIFSFVDFAYASQDLRSPVWKAFGHPLIISRLILEEFTIVDQLVFLLDSLLWFAFFGWDYKGSVECPDHTTLAEIIEGSLTAQLGPSLVLFYRTHELFPLSQMRALAKMGSDASGFVKYRQPAAYIGINKDKCVLIAYVGRDDVRKMNIWTQSSLMTRNIVTKCRNAVLSIKPYEAE